MLIVRLNSCSRAGANRGAESLTNLVEKPSYPVELEYFTFFIVSRISDCDVLERISDSAVGVPGYFLSQSYHL